MQTQTQTPTSRHTDRHAIVDTQVKAHTGRHKQAQKHTYTHQKLQSFARLDCLYIFSIEIVLNDGLFYCHFFVIIAPDIFSSTFQTERK